MVLWLLQVRLVSFRISSSLLSSAAGPDFLPVRRVTPDIHHFSDSSSSPSWVKWCRIKAPESDALIPAAALILMIFSQAIVYL